MMSRKESLKRISDIVREYCNESEIEDIINYNRYDDQVEEEDQDPDEEKGISRNRVHKLFCARVS